MSKFSNKESLYERMRYLAQVNGENKINENKNNSLGTLIDYKKGEDNITYGIVKENHQYFIKKSTKKENPKVEDFVYIGGLENIHEHKYNKLSEADKNRNMLLLTIKEGLKPISKKSSKKMILEAAEEEIEKAEDMLDRAEAKADEPDPKSEVDVEVPVDIDTNGDEKDIVPKPEEKDIASEPEEKDVTPEPEEKDIASEPEEKDVTDVDEHNREIQKMVGKITNLVRKTNMTSPQVKSYINSFLASFEDKLPEIDIEDRKEMADKLIEVIPSSKKDLEQSDVVTDIEEAKTCNECGFAKYVEGRGYTSEALLEASPDEKASLMSGYALDIDDEIPEEDYASMALISSPEIQEILTNEYSQGDLVESMKPFCEQLNEVEDAEKKSKVDGMFWWMIDPQKGNMTEREDDEEEQDKISDEQNTDSDEYNEEEINSPEDFKEYAITVLKKAHGEDFDPDKAEYMIKGLTNMVKVSDDEDWGAAVGILQQSLSEGMNGNDPANVEVQPNMNEELENDENPEITPGFDTLGVDTIKPDNPKTTSVDVNVNKDNGTVNVSMTEGEIKLRKYIRDYLNVKNGNKKSNINESKKSDKLKKLDKIIDEQHELIKKVLNENKSLNEIFGLSLKEKFEKLNPDDVKSVEKLFDEAFKESLKLGARKKAAMQLTPEIKYDLLKQGYEKDKLKNPGFGKIKGGKFVYTPTKTQNPFTSGGTGGKTSIGGV